MTLRLSTYVRTNDFKDLHTYADAAVAAGQAALTVAACNKFSVLSLPNFKSSAISNVAAGAIVGACIRLAYKVHETFINDITDLFVEKTGFTGMPLNFGRKVVEIFIAAGITRFALTILSGALPTIVPAFSTKFSTYLALSILENIRPITIGTRSPGYNLRSFASDKQTVIGPRLRLELDKNWMPKIKEAKWC